MRETQITVPELMLVAGTRAMLGAGLGLLLADRMSDESRRAVDWTLFAVGAVTTIPLALEVFGGDRVGRIGTQATARRSHPRSNERRSQSAFAET